MYPLIAQAQKVDTTKYEINAIEFIINGDIKETELRSLMQTIETPSWFSKFLYYKVSEKIGNPTEYFDPITFGEDIQKIKLKLEDFGYFHSSIDTTLQYNTHTVDITISINTNQRSYLDTVNISGIENIASDIREDILNNTSLQKGDPYIVENIEKENARIFRIFYSSGYRLAELKKITPLRYLSTNNISLTMEYNAGKRYYFGEITIIPDTTEEKKEIPREVITRQLDFQYAHLFNEYKRSEGEQNLNRLGLFESARIRTAQLPDSNATAFPIVITYSLLDMQELTPEILMNDENESFTFGIGLGYSHKNLFNNATSFSIRSRARAQALDRLYFPGLLRYGLKENTLLTKADIQMQIAQPYFFSNKLSVSFNVGVEVEKQYNVFFNIVRSRLRFINKFATYTLGFGEYTIERSDKDVINPQLSTIIDTTIAPEVTRQFNNIISFTLQRDKTNNIFSPSEGFFHSGTIEEAGFISSLLDNLGSNLPYSQYLKFSFLGRHYFATNQLRSNIFAIKLRGGVAGLYNSNNQTPIIQQRRFFQGGSGSVRGWASRTLATFPNPDQGGNIFIDGSIEQRLQFFPTASQKLLGIQLNAIWGIFFFDYGNLWNRLEDMHLSQIALAFGGGLRYETIIGPIRFDVGFKLYDPSEKPYYQWIFKRKFLSSTTIHFGLGHAF